MIEQTIDERRKDGIVEDSCSIDVAYAERHMVDRARSALIQEDGHDDPFPAVLICA
jgi:hypothetical protein